MNDDERNPEPEQYSRWKRLMRGLVKVKSEEVEEKKQDTRRAPSDSEKQDEDRA